jgi:hypothetical protein
LLFDFTYTTGSQVTSHPLGISIALLLVAEHRLELVTESKVQSLRREVPNNIGSVTTPQRQNTLRSGGAAEGVYDTGVGPVQTAGLDHLILC